MLEPGPAYTLHILFLHFVPDSTFRKLVYKYEYLSERYTSLSMFFPLIQSREVKEVGNILAPPLRDVCPRASSLYPINS